MLQVIAIAHGGWVESREGGGGYRALAVGVGWAATYLSEMEFRDASHGRRAFCCFLLSCKVQLLLFHSFSPTSVCFPSPPQLPYLFWSEEREYKSAPGGANLGNQKI